MIMSEADIYWAALAKWGETAQILTAQGKCSELAAKLYQTFFCDQGCKADVASGIADVEIICGQIRLIVGDSLVDLEKADKLSRLARLLEE